MIWYNMRLRKNKLIWMLNWWCICLVGCMVSINHCWKCEVYCYSCFPRNLIFAFFAVGLLFAKMKITWPWNPRIGVSKEKKDYQRTETYNASDLSLWVTCTPSTHCHYVVNICIRITKNQNTLFCTLLWCQIK